MIDFTYLEFRELKQVNSQAVLPSIQPLLLADELIVSAFQYAKGFVAFTTKRIIAEYDQGYSGKKTDFPSLPYSRIQMFSVESLGSFDRDGGLNLLFSDKLNIYFSFSGSVNISAIAQTIAGFALK